MKDSIQIRWDELFQPT